MRKEQYLASQIEDKIEQSRRNFYITKTDFLNLNEQSLALSIVRNMKNDIWTFFYGGYDEAERKIMISVPSELVDTEEEALKFEEILSVLHVETAKAAPHLTHRDYLGAILSLGIERSVIGDILVREHGADIIVLSKIADFLLTEFHSAGRENLKVTIGDLESLELPEKKRKIIQASLASLRFDNIVSSAFGLSRAESVKMIKNGRVFINQREEKKIDRKVELGSVISVRGKGKAVVLDSEGFSRKGRMRIKFMIYL